MGRNMRIAIYRGILLLAVLYAAVTMLSGCGQPVTITEETITSTSSCLAQAGGATCNTKPQSCDVVFVNDKPVSITNCVQK